MVDKTILVYDHLWLGHIPTYHIEICKGLLEKGYRVISASPKPFDVKTSLQNNLNCDLLEVRDVNLDYISNQNVSYSEDNGPKSTASTGSQSIRFNLVTVIYQIVSKISFFKKFFKNLENWKTLNRNIHEKINSTHITIFIPYLDIGWLHPLLRSRLISNKFDYNWAGIFFHPRSSYYTKSALFSPFKSKKCTAVYMLDEVVINSITNHKIKHKLRKFPDITNVEFETTFSTPLIQHINKVKHDKKVIALIGALDPRKNLKLFLATAIVAEEKNLPYMFVLAGPINLQLWKNRNEAEYVEKILKSPPKNLFVQLERIPDGIHYNAIIHNSDYIFAVYNNFTGSSNTLTKCSFFKKPVIVDKEFLMGQMVEKYRLGETISKKTPRDVLSVLQKIDTNVYDDKDFEQYYDQHSLSRLNKILGETFA